MDINNIFLKYGIHTFLDDLNADVVLILGWS